jgi:hypothetical protein
MIEPVDIWQSRLRAMAKHPSLMRDSDSLA